MLVVCRCRRFAARHPAVVLTVNRRTLILNSAAFGALPVIPALCSVQPALIPTTNTMINTLQSLGLTSGLQTCLDASDKNSYDGTSQTWVDTSGNANNFFRGWTGSAASDDPTFHGTAGNQSANEYFSFDGNDGFHQTGAQTFATSWHKDNATFTICGWFWMPAGASAPFALFSDDAAVASAVGITLNTAAASTTGRQRINLDNGSAGQGFSPAASNYVLEGQWVFSAFSFSEGSGASFVQFNATQRALTSDTYSSPSSAAPSGSNVIAGFTNASLNGFDPANCPAAGARLASVVAWSTALSSSQLAGLFASTRGKFGV